MKRSEIGPTVFLALRTFLLSHYNLHGRKGKGKEYDNFDWKYIFYESRGGSSDFRLQTSDLRLHTSNFTLQTWQSSNSGFLNFWPLRLNAAWLDFWPPTSHLPLLTSQFPLLTFDFRLPTSDFRLRFPTSDFQLPTSNFPLLTFDSRLDSSVRLDCRSIHHAGINAQGQGSVERTAVTV